MITGEALPLRDANFVLFGTFADRRAGWQGLVDRGVLIRQVGPPRWLRVSIGARQEMAAFRAALDAVLAAPDPRLGGIPSTKGVPSNP